MQTPARLARLVKHVQIGQPHLLVGLLSSRSQESTHASAARPDRNARRRTLSLSSAAPLVSTQLPAPPIAPLVRLDRSATTVPRRHVHQASTRLLALTTAFPAPSARSARVQQQRLPHATRGSTSTTRTHVLTAPQEAPASMRGTLPSNVQADTTQQLRQPAAPNVQQAANARTRQRRLLLAMQESTHWQVQRLAQCAQLDISAPQQRSQA